jgi:SAM-dependent methyltransferase
MHQFVCNICSAACSTEDLDRELSSCGSCGSNVRFRWIVHALSVELFGRSIPLHEFPMRKEIRGLGLSDPLPVASVLETRFAYQNTSFHEEPRFDIMEAAGEAEFDFIIASEVFEHVVPPVQTAFNNLERLLKPGGFAVFSCPWEAEGETAEHFPLLHDWQLVRLLSGVVLLNRTADGHLEVFENLAFHGGRGSTLEMRVFSKKGLLANCRAANFAEIDVAEDYPQWGIIDDPWSRGLILRKSAG